MTTHSKLPLSKISLIIAGIICLLSVVLWAGLFYEITSVQSDIADASSSLGQKVAAEKVLQAQAKLANDTTSERQALQSLAIPEGGGANFIAELEALGSAAQVTETVSSIAGKGPKGTSPGNLTLSLHVVGSFAGVLQFEELLETLPVAGSVGAITLQYNASQKEWDEDMVFSVLSFDTPS